MASLCAGGRELRRRAAVEGAPRENARLLNRVLFGDRDYAVIGYQPR